MSFLRFRRRTRTDEFHLLIFGGSQGARAINNAMADALEHLVNIRRIDLTITHQTGESDFEKDTRRIRGVDVLRMRMFGRSFRICSTSLARRI